MLVKVASAKMICVVRVFLTQSTLALNVKYQVAISAQRLKSTMDPNPKNNRAAS